MGAQKLSKTAKKVWESYFGDKEWGIDNYNNKIFKGAYRDEDSEYGWDIDHIYPKSLGGVNDIKNLRPLHIWANRHRNNNIFD